MADMVHVNDATFKTAMRKLAGGVSILTADDGTNRTGMTVSSVVSLSVEPAYFMLTINPNASTWKILENHKKLGINFLSEQHEKVALAFSGFTGIKGTDRFNEGDWKCNEGFWLLNNASATFGCEIVKVIPEQGNNILIAKVLHTHIKDDSQKSLVYKNGKYYAV